MQQETMNARKKVDLYELIKFFREGQHRFEMREEPDSAFVLEMLAEFFENDYKENKPLIFTGGAVGL